MHRWVIVLVIGILVPGVLGAGEAKRVPQEYLDSIVDDDPNPLPRGLAPGETVPVLDWADRIPLTPPTGTVRTPPEYALNDGMLIRWGSFNALLTEMTVGVTTGTDATIWVVVSSGLLSSATTTLSGAGANMDQVEFIIYSADSVWIRDYGPRFISEDGARSIVDHTYNRSRPNDNAFPDHLTTLWGEMQYDIPLVHGGGNFHLFGDGEAFMSELILDENSGLTAQDVEDLFMDYEGLDLTIMPPFPTWYDSTQHIDMWMLPVADREVIIGEYPAGDSQVYTVTEDAVTLLEGRGYTVHRTPGWSSGGTHYTYTNSVVINEVVLACQFANANPGYADEDAAAVATFEAIYPDRQIVPVDCSAIIGYSGAIHCIVMHVPDVEPPLFADGFETGDTSA
ncbi:MAG: agmatine deiminase family protein, partial [Acidobacteria bacterium]|nr:agmatine deiminase family protein [Acidobacteriota bacterium]